MLSSYSRHSSSSSMYLQKGAPCSFKNRLIEERKIEAFLIHIFTLMNKITNFGDIKNTIVFYQ